MDIYTLIHHDHEAVKKLIKQINVLPETSYSERFFLFKQLKEEVLMHNDAEDSSFFIELERYADASEKIINSRKEHAEFADMLGKLSDTNIKPGYWDNIFTEFQEALSRHIEEEEGELFSKARNILSRQQAAQLVRTMIDLKSRKQELLNKAV